mmetsp:Transcript_12527/g.36483  ORF Transcript_12527/g.36483 Transcript_12527/m.36483 type:complete len:254 (+) Transcript_12527:546-1307(+)
MIRQGDLELWSREKPRGRRQQPPQLVVQLATAVLLAQRESEHLGAAVHGEECKMLLGQPHERQGRQRLGEVSHTVVRMREPVLDQAPAPGGVDRLERREHGHGPLVVDPGDKVAEWREDLERAVHGLQGIHDEALRDVTAGHLSPMLDPGSDRRLIGLHIKYRYPVVWKPGSDILELSSIKVRVSQRAVNPDVLTVLHGHGLRDLDQELRLSVAHGPSGLSIILDVTWPLWHHQLEAIVLNMNNVLQREETVL